MAMLTFKKGCAARFWTMIASAGVTCTSTNAGSLRPDVPAVPGAPDRGDPPEHAEATTPKTRTPTTATSARGATRVMASSLSGNAYQRDPETKGTPNGL